MGTLQIAVAWSAKLVAKSRIRGLRRASRCSRAMLIRIAEVLYRYLRDEASMHNSCTRMREGRIEAAYYAHFCQHCDVYHLALELHNQRCSRRCNRLLYLRASRTEGVHSCELIEER